MSLFGIHSPRALPRRLAKSSRRTDRSKGNRAQGARLGSLQVLRQGAGVEKKLGADVLDQDFDLLPQDSHDQVLGIVKAEPVQQRLAGPRHRRRG